MARMWMAAAMEEEKLGGVFTPPLPSDRLILINEPHDIGHLVWVRFDFGGMTRVNDFVHVAWHHLDQAKSLFNSSLRASFPARLAAAVVSK